MSVSGKGFPAFNYTAEAQAVEELIETWEPMRKLSPDTGAYINEVSCHALVSEQY